MERYGMQNKKNKGLIFVLLAGFGSAILSDSCCLVPTLFLLFGISFGGLINLPALNEYRWHFAALSIVFIVYGTYKIFFSKKDIVCCEKDAVKKRYTVFFVFLLALSLAALLYPFYEGYIWGE